MPVNVSKIRCILGTDTNGTQDTRMKGKSFRLTRLINSESRKPRAESPIYLIFTVTGADAIPLQITRKSLTPDGTFQVRSKFVHSRFGEATAIVLWSCVRT